ncbi:MAG TPA: hypothetical protein VIL95_06540 [Bacillota bacterium]
MPADPENDTAWQPQALTFTVRDSVATITLNQPNVAKALNQQLSRELFR